MSIIKSKFLKEPSMDHKKLSLGRDSVSFQTMTLTEAPR